MKIEPTLDELHVAVTRRRWAQLFTAFVRVLLGVAFIPPSIRKILHQPFSVLPDTHPVGAYFNALYNTGYYYDFLGWTQLTAAILLMIPRTSHIGALIFFPIIVNIAVLTSSVGFTGTWLITILMSLAALYLVCWEYDRLKAIIFQSRRDRTDLYRLYYLAIPAFFAAGGFILNFAFRYFLIGNLTDHFRYGLILAGIGLGFGILVAAHYRFMPVGHLDE